MTSRVRRDGAWLDGLAADLVPGDIVQISLGDVVPADVLLIDGSLLLDQSMLTGESVPTKWRPGRPLSLAAWSSRRGDRAGNGDGNAHLFRADGGLVSVAHVESAEQKAVLSVVRNLTVNQFRHCRRACGLCVRDQSQLEQILLLVLTALLSAVPVALPATFTLAAALGARTLALKGVLLTRLSSLNEAAMVDVICCDKTGTLTRNELVVSAIRPVKPGCDELDVLAFAALASSPEGQDPIDFVIRTMAAREPRPRLAECDALHAVRSGGQNGRGDRCRGGARDSSGQGRPGGRRDGRADDAGGWESARSAELSRISDHRRCLRGKRCAGTNRLHRLQRPAARRFGVIADRLALAGRTPDHAHRRRGRHRDNRRAPDRARGAVCPPSGIPVGVEPKDFYASVSKPSLLAAIHPFGKGSTPSTGSQRRAPGIYCTIAAHGPAPE